MTRSERAGRNLREPSTSAARLEHARPGPFDLTIDEAAELHVSLKVICQGCKHHFTGYLRPRAASELPKPAFAFDPSMRKLRQHEPAHSYRAPNKLPPQPANGNYGGPKVRDRLCQIIRQHQLDPNLVKSYATDYCGVKTLREAKREQVEAFVVHLADWAEKDRNALLCQLNSYLSPKEDAA